MPKKTVKPPADSDSIKPKHPGGRPSTYNLERGIKICRVISTHTIPLQKMCDTYDFFPKHKCSIHEWRLDYPEFAALYAEAKRHQADLLAEEIAEISDNSTRDLIETEKGWVANAAKVQRDRLRVDTRKWIACKLLPKVYGDKTQDSNSSLGQNIQIIAEAMEALKEKHAKDY
ncbi:MAG: hypothetical protein KIH63_004570 [Candidatus Saccharibacteria bacterium]|nr:hypothetical protein [Candidatus Saccharibacteria bacterium]